MHAAQCLWDRRQSGLSVSVRHTVCCAALTERGGGFFCGGATLVKGDELMLHGCWNRGKTLPGKKKQGKGGNGGGWGRGGGLRGRMFHFASQACATVDGEGGRRRWE